MKMFLFSKNRPWSLVLLPPLVAQTKLPQKKLTAKKTVYRTGHKSDDRCYDVRVFFIVPVIRAGFFLRPVLWFFFIKDVQDRPAPYDRCYRRLSETMDGSMIFFQRSVLWSEENRNIWPVLWSIAEGVEVVRSGLWSTTFIWLEMVRSGLWSSSILSSCVHASACAGQ